MILFTFFLFLFCSLSSMEKNEYHIWVNGSRHAKYLPEDQIHSLSSYFRKCELTEKNGSYKGYFGSYSMMNPGPSKINYFYWGLESLSRDGRLSANARKEAGKALFQILNNITSRNKNAKFALYGFSHGGNVIAECIEEIYRQKSNVLLDQVYFLDTPKTEWTEKAIHRKKSETKYIAEEVYNIFPKKRAGLPWHLFDWTASFPCCGYSFLFGREDLFDLQIDHLEATEHSFFGEENNFLKVSELDTKINRDILSNEESKARKTCSKNPFRWMLYYRKYIYLACFIAAMQQYLKKRNKKYEFLIVMR